MSNEFKPIVLTKEHLSIPEVKVMLEMVQKEIINEWNIGTKFGRISSRFVVPNNEKDTEDILTSPDLNDTDYKSLLQAHLHRLMDLCDN